MIVAISKAGKVFHRTLEVGGESNDDDENEEDEEEEEEEEEDGRGVVSFFGPFLSQIRYTRHPSWYI